MKLIDRIISPLAPLLCLLCSKEGALICAWCFEEALPDTAQRCVGCGALSEQSKTCQTCQKAQQLPAHVWVRADYDDMAKQLVSRLKFARTYKAADIIASYLDEAISYLDEQTVIVHVPTAPKRYRQRGYDPAQLIAASLAKQRKLRSHTLLYRLTNVRQVGASRVQRKTQLESAFSVSDNIDTKTPILLVDDIYTTGGSLSAATKTLKNAGYKNISAAIFARAI